MAINLHFSISKTRLTTMANASSPAYSPTSPAYSPMGPTSPAYAPISSIPHLSLGAPSSESKSEEGSIYDTMEDHIIRVYPDGRVLKISHRQWLATRAARLPPPIAQSNEEDKYTQHPDFADYTNDDYTNGFISRRSSRKRVARDMGPYVCK